MPPDHSTPDPDPDVDPDVGTAGGPYDEPAPAPSTIGPNLDAWDTDTAWDTTEPATEPATGLADAGAAYGNGGGSSDGTEVQLRYPTVADWVEQWLSPMISRPVNVARSGRRFAWCPQWWRHPEAIDRLQATWRAWEAARVSPDPAAIANWWLLVLDPMLDRILDEDGGPFARCFNNGEHRPQHDPLPCAPAPAGWWPQPASISADQAAPPAGGEGP